MSERTASSGLARRMLIYFIGNIATKLITLVLTRLQTGRIVPEDYGAYSLLTTLLPQLVSICFFEVWSGVLRFMFDEDETRRPSVFTNALLLSAILMPLFLVGLGLLLWINSSLNLFWPLLLMGVVTLLDHLYQFSSRGLGFNRLFAVTGIVASLVLGLSQIAFLVIWDLGGMAMIWSPILAAVVSILIYELRTGLLRGMHWRQLEAPRIRALARFCFPLAINATAYFALSKFNEIYVRRMDSEIALSQLTAANRMGMFVTLFITVFSLAWQETAFAVSGAEDRGDYYSLTFNRYLRVIGASLICLVPFGRLVFSLLINPQYYGEETRALIPAALLAIAFSALSNFMGHLFSAEKRTEQLFYSTALGALFNLVAMLLLYPRIGLQAANIALALGFLVNLVYRLLLIQRSVRVGVAWRAALTLLVAFAAVTLVFYLWPEPGVQVASTAGAALFSLWLLRVELGQLWSVLRRRIGARG